MGNLCSDADQPEADQGTVAPLKIARKPMSQIETDSVLPVDNRAVPTNELALVKVEEVAIDL